MLDDLNKERKDIGKDMESFAWDVIEMEGQDDKMTRVVHGEDFHEGVIGIVAGKIKENTNRPTIVFANADHPGYIKGSGRSVPGLHLRDALDLVYKEHPEIFAGFGGHAMAAGLTIDASRLDDFKIGFEKAVDFLMDSTPFEKTLEIDAHLPTSYINVETTLAIQNEVWGQGFQDPRWIGTFKVIETRLLGKDQNHVKMLLEKDGQQFDAIQFFNEKEPQINDVIDIAYKLGINDFRGINVQLMVEEKEER
jgi:single-stranded-DNA-specific exonuclease